MTKFSSDAAFPDCLPHVSRLFNVDSCDHLKFVITNGACIRVISGDKIAAKTREIPAEHCLYIDFCPNLLSSDHGCRRLFSYVIKYAQYRRHQVSHGDPEEISIHEL
jgi:hypothetical protein